jgi:hypothetical protein
MDQDPRNRADALRKEPVKRSAASSYVISLKYISLWPVLFQYGAGCLSVNTRLVDFMSYTSNWVWFLRQPRVV